MWKASYFRACRVILSGEAKLFHGEQDFPWLIDSIYGQLYLSYG